MSGFAVNVPPLPTKKNPMPACAGVKNSERNMMMDLIFDSTGEMINLLVFSFKLSNKT